MHIHDVILAKHFRKEWRVFNHSCDPNCVTEECTVSGGYRVGVVAARGIEAGEEITFNYGREYKIETCIYLKCFSEA